MKKLKALTTALQDAGAFKDSDYSAVDQGAYFFTGKDLGHGIEVAKLKYDAHIQIENLPDRDSYTLLVFIPAWLADNDADRERDGLADPDIDISLNGDGTADVELLIEFEESLQLIPDESGSIPYNGQMWTVADVPIDVAEGVDKVARQSEEANG
ncbi:MAG: hypothetical protein CL942_08310 [Desulfovibrio sp.]|nr:hypothetical protein [Desulfovibrio sp.]|tara:strand:- start:693 stop:1157 length:465 start_codon:yes stop_codon:yes gene_type:complete